MLWAVRVFVCVCGFSNGHSDATEINGEKEKERPLLKLAYFLSSL